MHARQHSTTAHKRNLSNSFRLNMGTEFVAQDDTPPKTASHARRVSGTPFNKTTSLSYTHPRNYLYGWPRRRLRVFLLLVTLGLCYFYFSRRKEDASVPTVADVESDPSIHVVDRAILNKLKNLEYFLGQQQQPQSNEFTVHVETQDQMDPDEARYLSPQGQKADAPPLVTAIPEPIKPVKEPAKELTRDPSTLVDVATLDATYCPDSPGGCKFLLPAFLGEQETKAQMHLYNLGLLAVALNRTLVLPNVIRSRMGSCYANPFSYYYAPDALSSRGIPTISQAEFIEWTNVRQPPATAQLVNMANVKPGYSTGAIEIDSTSDSATFPDKPDRKICLAPPRSWANFTQWSPLAIYPPDKWYKQDDTRLAYGEGVVTTLKSEEVIRKSFRNVDKLKLDKKVPVESPDVLVVNYELRFGILNTDVLSTLEPARAYQFEKIAPEFTHFPYSPAWTELSQNLARSLQPFVAIHWRQETIPVENLMPCTEKLLEMLRDLSARFPDLERVYLATDYPIEDLEAGRDSIVAHSGTFARLLTEDHHRAMRIFLAAFKSGSVGNLQLTTYEREQLKGNVKLPDSAIEGQHVNLAELDSGLLGIVDKNVAMWAELFISGQPGVCGKLSSFTDQIRTERQTRMEEEMGHSQGEVVIEKGRVWDLEQVFSIEEAKRDELTGEVVQ